MPPKTEALAAPSDDKHDDTGLLANRADAISLIKDGGYSIQRDFKFPEDGTALRGKYIGPGAIIHVDSQSRPGEKDAIRTWLVESPSGDVTWQVMGSVGLDKYMVHSSGTHIIIVFNGEKALGKGRKMNDFTVAAKR